MAVRGRSGMPPAQVRELWDRWKRGESAVAIAQALGCTDSGVRKIVRRRGGVAPPERSRRERDLSLCEREEISRGLAAGESMSAIGRRIGRDKSTVSREIQRHGGPRAYRAAAADARAWCNAKRPKACVLATNERLRDLVAEKLAEDWSPQQISCWLRLEYPDDEVMRVSHETIYLTLFVQARGALKRELITHLRRVKSVRRSKHATREGTGRGQIVDAVSIRERPAEVEDRAIPGHWEGDLIHGKLNTFIATLVERHSRFVKLVHVTGKDTQSVVTALTREVICLPQELRRSLTWDRGHELAQHAKFTVATDVDVYFCDPASPWQRGSNENTNGLLRQYFPKGSDLSIYTQRDLDEIALRLNTRPRKTLGYRTPAYTLDQALQ